MLNIILSTVAAILIITAAALRISYVRWRRLSHSGRVRQLTEWQLEAFEAIAGPNDAFITDYYLCALAETVCRMMHVDIREQKDLFKILNFLMFHDGRGGSSCTQPECKELIRRATKDPVARAFSLALNHTVNYYADNNTAEIVMHKAEADARRMTRIVWFTLGHEWKHTEQTYAFIQQGRPSAVAQILLLNPIVIILTLGWTYRKYSAIPSETEANENGYRLVNG